MEGIINKSNASISATPVHYKLLGLLPEEIDINDEEVNLNALMSQALSAIAFMPYGYLLDKYRWDYYQGKISDEELNCAWVKARADIQGL